MLPAEKFSNLANWAFVSFPATEYQPDFHASCYSMVTTDLIIVKCTNKLRSGA